MICEPLELEYLAAAASRLGHDAVIIDMILENKPISYFVKKYNPDIVGFTSYITHVGVVLEYAGIIKKLNSDIFTMVGGVHAEVNPQDFLDKNIDCIVKANGIKTFNQVCQCVAAGKKKHACMIDGVWSGPNKEYTIDTEFIFPYPDREKTKKYRYRYNYIYHEGCALIKTSFGCSFRCDFCFCVEITGRKYFERDIEDVVSELKEIPEKNIFIVDDNFLFKKERVLEFCGLLDANNIRKYFILFGRSDFIVNNEDVIKILAEHGLKAVFVGIESFKQEELSHYNKKISVTTNIDAVRILEKNDIDCYSGIIVGMDWQDEDFTNLAGWLNQFEQPAVNIQPITPIPGTPKYRELCSEITVEKNRYELWDMAHLVMKPKKMSARRFYYNIVKTYTSSSAGLSAHLYILKKYGLKVYVNTLIGVITITWQYMKLMLNPDVHVKDAKGNTG
jgi:radical SAM superfamily enzyme YgiQ (UPF0313 family)